MMKTLVLFSGGTDSYLCLMKAVDGFGIDNVVAMSIDYGQPHKVEIEKAKTLCNKYGIRHIVKCIGNLSKTGDIFEGRNLLIVANAVPVALSEGACQIMLGCNLDDQPFFPDCTTDFMDGLTKAVKSGYGISVIYPLSHMTKKEVVTECKKYGWKSDFTHTCYTPVGDKSCGVCFSCKVLEEAIK